MRLQQTLNRYLVSSPSQPRDPSRKTNFLHLPKTVRRCIYSYAGLTQELEVQLNYLPPAEVEDYRGFYPGINHVPPQDVCPELYVPFIVVFDDYPKGPWNLDRSRSLSYFLDSLFPYPVLHGTSRICRVCHDLEAINNFDTQGMRNSSRAEHTRRSLQGFLAGVVRKLSGRSPKFDSSPFRFMDLPEEIRLQILECSGLVTPHELIWVPGTQRNRPRVNSDGFPYDGRALLESVWPQEEINAKEVEERAEILQFMKPLLKHCWNNVFFQLAWPADRVLREQDEAEFEKRVMGQNFDSGVRGKHRHQWNGYYCDPDCNYCPPLIVDN
ncbi:hypothetical protein G7Y89_g14947 [Cudoniella acicularis]|uniref:Uncharacterized protein n=1 Tax=Cudoniella acicularis TaxID=354080 RepID=A0A8H4VPN6_9HELO|nr:hypothetical protein G7Y89_g14947 [Cudoniella acicularis]